MPLVHNGLLSSTCLSIPYGNSHKSHRWRAAGSCTVLLYSSSAGLSAFSASYDLLLSGAASFVSFQLPPEAYFLVHCLTSQAQRCHSSLAVSMPHYLLCRRLPVSEELFGRQRYPRFERKIPPRRTRTSCCRSESKKRSIRPWEGLTTLGRCCT